MNEVEATQTESKPRPNLKRRARLMIALIILLLLMGVHLAVGTDRLQIEKVVSESMEPTLLVSDTLLIDRNAVPQRYDIVIVNDPEHPDEKLVKRIIGLPTDVVTIDGGILYVNGKEEYSRQVSDNHLEWHNTKTVVPFGKIFVLGDNRNNSYDSLNFGPVDQNEIRGVMLGIIWPPSRWRRVQPFD